MTEYRIPNRGFVSSPPCDENVHTNVYNDIRGKVVDSDEWKVLHENVMNGVRSQCTRFTDLCTRDQHDMIQHVMNTLNAESVLQLLRGHVDEWTRHQDTESVVQSTLQVTSLALQPFCYAQRATHLQSFLKPDLQPSTLWWLWCSLLESPDFDDTNHIYYVSRHVVHQVEVYFHSLITDRRIFRVGLALIRYFPNISTQHEGEQHVNRMRDIMFHVLAATITNNNTDALNIRDDMRLYVHNGDVAYFLIIPFVMAYQLASCQHSNEHCVGLFRRMLKWRKSLTINVKAMSAHLQALDDALLRYWEEQCGDEFEESAHEFMQQVSGCMLLGKLPIHTVLFVTTCVLLQSSAMLARVCAVYLSFMSITDLNRSSTGNFRHLLHDLPVKRVSVQQFVSRLSVTSTVVVPEETKDDDVHNTARQNEQDETDTNQQHQEQINEAIRTDRNTPVSTQSLPNMHATDTNEIAVALERSKSLPLNECLPQSQSKNDDVMKVAIVEVEREPHRLSSSIVPAIVNCVRGCRLLKKMVQMRARKERMANAKADRFLTFQYGNALVSLLWPKSVYNACQSTSAQSILDLSYNQQTLKKLSLTSQQVLPTLSLLLRLRMSASSDAKELVNVQSTHATTDHQELHLPPTKTSDLMRVKRSVNSLILRDVTRFSEHSIQQNNKLVNIALATLHDLRSVTYLRRRQRPITLIWDGVTNATSDKMCVSYRVVMGVDLKRPEYERLIHGEFHDSRTFYQLPMHQSVRLLVILKSDATTPIAWTVIQLYSNTGRPRIGKWRMPMLTGKPLPNETMTSILQRRAAVEASSHELCVTITTDETPRLSREFNVGSYVTPIIAKKR